MLHLERSLDGPHPIAYQTSQNSRCTKCHERNARKGRHTRRILAVRHQKSLRIFNLPYQHYILPGRSPAPAPPRRDPRTTLSVGRARAKSMVAGLGKSTKMFLMPYARCIKSKNHQKIRRVLNLSCFINAFCN